MGIASQKPPTPSQTRPPKQKPGHWPPGKGKASPALQFVISSHVYHYALSVGRQVFGGLCHFCGQESPFIQINSITFASCITKESCKMPEISVRGLEMPESPIRKLAPLAAEAKKRGIKVYHLNIGQPDLPTPQVGLDALKHIDRTILEYSPSQGYLGYREKLVGYYKRYNINVDADDIIITSGGSEAVLFAFLSCLNPGDEIIVPEPAYANYMAFAISAGAKIRTIATTIEEGFSLPKVEKFEELINDRTRAIMICNPNNPTGYLYTRREMNQIRDLVKKYDLYLFSDEVYREYIYTGSPYISACHLEGIEQNVILIDSVSKRYSECGIRIGALITKNAEVRKAVMKFCQARLSPPLIGQIVAEASLDAPEEYYRAVYDEYVERRK